MDEPDQISNYLNADPDDNIIILSPPTANGDVFANAVCSSRSLLGSRLRDIGRISLACVGPNGAFPVDTVHEFLRIDLRQFPVYVPVDDVRQAVRTTSQLQFFQILPSSLEIETTASKRAIELRDFVSSDHCQAGTNKQIYRLAPVKFTS